MGQAGTLERLTLPAEPPPQLLEALRDVLYELELEYRIPIADDHVARRFYSAMAAASDSSR